MISNSTIVALYDNFRHCLLDLWPSCKNAFIYFICFLTLSWILQKHVRHNLCKTSLFFFSPYGKEAIIFYGQSPNGLIFWPQVLEAKNTNIWIGIISWTGVLTSMIHSGWQWRFVLLPAQWIHKRTNIFVILFKFSSIYTFVFVKKDKNAVSTDRLSSQNMCRILL